MTGRLNAAPRGCTWPPEQGHQVGEAQTPPPGVSPGPGVPRSCIPQEVGAAGQGNMPICAATVSLILSPSVMGENTAEKRQVGGCKTLGTLHL